MISVLIEKPDKVHQFRIYKHFSTIVENVKKKLKMNNMDLDRKIFKHLL